MVAGVPYERDRMVKRPRVGGAQRQMRRPQHRFNLVTKPYQIQPCAIAPVLPGETLTHSMLQAQVWSDPLADGMKNVGWWKEYFGFYVRFTDLIGWDEEGQIGNEVVDMLTTNASLAAFQDADGNAWTYAYPGAIDYVLEATKSVVGAYFRDEGELWNDYLLDSVPLAAIYGGGASDWTDKLTLAADYADRTEPLPATMGELDNAMTSWLALRDAGLTTMDYNDWLRTYGGGDQMMGDTPDSPRYHMPELAFHFREWGYPTNTVEPTTGEPSTAAGWRVAAENKKRLFFAQPGWLVVFSLVRPKVYLGTQQGNIAGVMQSQSDWLPAVLNAELDLGHKMFTDTTGPLAAVMTTGYWIDLRDLLNYGDQFVNYATPATGTAGVPFVSLPAVDANRRYASATQIMALFADTTNGRFRQDGVCSLSIATNNKQPAGQTLTLGATT